jgi:hypothetical protein
MVEQGSLERILKRYFVISGFSSDNVVSNENLSQRDKPSILIYKLAKAMRSYLNEVDTLLCKGTIGN